MRFHVQNVGNFIQEALKILLMIISVICPSSGYKYEIEAMNGISIASSLSSSSSGAAAAAAAAATMKADAAASAFLATSGSATEATPLELSTLIVQKMKTGSSDSINTSSPSDSTAEDSGVKSVLSTEQPAPFDLSAFSQRLFSMPTKKISITNDSNEIDSENYVMAKHIASHDVDDVDVDVDEDVDDDNDVNDDNNDNVEDDTDDDNDDDHNNKKKHDGTATRATEADIIRLEGRATEAEAEAEIETEMKIKTIVTATHMNEHEHEHEHARSRSRLLQQEHLMHDEHFNKTKDLSSLSLLSINNAADGNNDDDDNGNDDSDDSDKSPDATALQKRLVDQRQEQVSNQQQHQQQHQHQHQHERQQPQKFGNNNAKNIGNIIINNSNNNNNNIKARNKNSMNGTTSSFQHLGSQRIALKSSDIQPTSLTNIISNQKVSNMKNIAIGSSSSSATVTTTSLTARKIESKYVLPKPQKTDAPMLNYIFDTFSSANKHHHHDQRYGPHFEDVQRVGQPTNMTVQAGSSIHLNCRISLLQDKTVSWVRRNPLGENALDLLTVGLHTYTGDKRYKLEFQYPNNWRLKITNVKKDDEATYECQISTHPPRVIQINLLVNAPKVMIVDEFGDPLQEKYYEIDSTLQLSCVVRNVAMATSVVYWKHGADVLNYDVTRGGVSVKTELMDDGANSTLSIAKINKADSGNYTCSISDFQNFTIVVHILNGESFAELHHGGSARMTLRYYHHTLAINLTLLILLLCLPATFIPR